MYIEEMRAPAVRLFNLMVGDGLTTERAFARLRSEGGHSTTNADLDLRSNDDGLHIREITTLKNPLHPSVAPGAAALAGWGISGDRPLQTAGDGDLATGDVIPFLGQAGDGVADELFFYVDVDGVEPGDESDLDVTVAVDGEDIGTWSLDGDAVRRIDDSTVRIRIRQPLSFDVQPGQAIALKATTNLPDDGESEHEVTTVLENPTFVVSSVIESETSEGFIRGEVKAEIQLAFDEDEAKDELALAESVGPLEYVRFEVSLPLGAGCAFQTSTVDGRLEVKEGEVSFSDSDSGDFGVPDEILLIVYPEISERLTIVCPQGSEGLDMIHWFSGFFSFHSGAGGDENEYDESRGGLVIRGWEAGDGAVYARKIYERSFFDDEITLKESTTMELQGPTDYGGN